MALKVDLMLFSKQIRIFNFDWVSDKDQKKGMEKMGF